MDTSHIEVMTRMVSEMGSMRRLASDSFSHLPVGISWFMGVR